MRIDLGIICHSLVVLFFFCHHAVATVLLEEGFAYSPGNLTAPWSSPGAQIQVITGSLTYPGLLDITGGSNKVTITSTTTARTQSRSFTSVSSATLYCGFIIQCTNLPSNTSSTYLIGVVTNTGTGVTGGADPILLYLQPAGAGYQFRIRHTGGSLVTATNVLYLNEVHFLVMKYTFGGTGQADLFIDPSPLAFEPTNSNATATGTNDAINLGVVSIKAQASTSGQGNWNIDSLRIGTAWADVTPSSSGCNPASVNMDPANRTAAEGTMATFSIGASGTSATFQWQVRTNGGSNWSNVISGSGATNLAYTTPVLSTNDSGNQYRCVVNVSCGGSSTAISGAATLTVTPCAPAAISADPMDQTVTNGTAAIFSIIATGSNPAYQWQLSTNGGGSWNSVNGGSGATNTVYTTPKLTVSDSGKQYRCIVNVSCGLGSTATSGVANVAVAAAGPPPLPVINITNIFNVLSYGAVADGVTDNSSAIQNAIYNAYFNGGGTVEIPAAGSNSYLSGPITMLSGINLQIDSGAELQMLSYGNWPGTTPFISGSSLQDIEISGSGIIDGQGAGWWGPPLVSARPNLIQFSGGSTRILIQDVKLRNAPTSHLMLKGNNANITIQRIDIDTPGFSPNTDGMDIGSVNMLIRDCHISDGDDNIEIGGSSAFAGTILITNCIFGRGHGVSFGSLLQAGVSDVTVINCIFTNTDHGIRLKSDYDRGGPVENLSFYNLAMTNISFAPILIYSYYNTYGAPTAQGVTPSVAASQTNQPVSSSTPVWRNIVFSNLTATAGQPGMIWARTELPATNITFIKLNIQAFGSFEIYNARGVQVVDSTIYTGGYYSFALFNAETTFYNSVPGVSVISLTGQSVTNGLTFYNQSAYFYDGTMFDASRISLSGSMLNDGTGLSLAPTTPVDFTLGTNPASISVGGDLTLNSVINLAAGDGFGPGTYSLFSYTGSLYGVPALGTVPSGFNYVLTNTAGQLEVLVSAVSPTITNQPASLSVQVGQPAGFSVLAGGTAPLRYQWYFNTNTPLPNATNSTFTIQSAQFSDAGAYSVIVTNAVGSATSAVATLTIAPSILAQPTNLTVTVGQPAGFGVLAGGTAPLRYQWYFNTNTPLLNATNSTFTILSPQLSDAGAYSVIVTNAGGSATSAVASLSVKVPISPFPITSIRFLAPDALALTWNAVSSQVYQVQSVESLPATNWQVLGSVTSALNTATFTNTGLLSVPRRLYRVVAMP